MSRNYIKYKNFCPQFKSHINPYMLALTSDVDKNFDIGDQGTNYGPKYKSSQLLVGQYISCAKEWDFLCEYASRVNEMDASIQFNPTNIIFSPQEKSMSTGEIFIYIAAFMKYANFYNCKLASEYYDPTNPNSPIITDVLPEDNSAYFAFERIDPKEVDKDVLMDKIIDKPAVYFRILSSIRESCKKSNIDLTGTKLGVFFENNKKIFERK